MVQLVSVKKMRSPLLPDFLRIEAEIRFEHADPQTVWFDLPERFEPYLNDRGEPWLVLLLPCAVVAGENLSLDLPVDPLLLYNLQGVQRVWQSWYDWAKPIKIEAPVLANPVAGTETALFFSGGVDSYFSLLGAHQEIDRTPNAPLSSLLMIRGFNELTYQPDEVFAQACERGTQAAAQFNKQFIPIVTNLRELTGYGRQHWTKLSGSAALGSVGHLFSNRFQNILIASSLDYGFLVPNGTHPLVDPQFSSAQTRVIYDGGASTRVEKTERVSAVPKAAGDLHVCTRANRASNCSNCEKCLRTMVTFDLLDKQHLAESFDWSDYSLELVARQFLEGPPTISRAVEIQDAAREHGRLDIVRAVDRSLRLSKRLRAIIFVVSMVCKLPVLRRYKHKLRRLVKKKRKFF